MLYDDIVPRLKAALLSAMKVKDAPAVSALRSALSALDNAAAVPVSTSEKAVVTSEYIAGAAQGLGAAEAIRRTLSDEEIAAILADEVAAHQEEARHFASLGRDEEADAATRQAQVIQGIK